MVTEAAVVLCGAGGAPCGQLRLTILPGRHQQSFQSLWIIHPERLLSDGPPTYKVEILEGHEYRYEWLDLSHKYLNLRAGPEEIFQPDTADGLTGRLRPKLATGIVQVTLHDGELLVGGLELEVRSRKLAYRSEYQWMLRDIASRATELVMNRFATSGSRFEQDETRDAITLYQRFTFLRAVIDGEGFQGAMREIFRRPHTSWETSREWIYSAGGLRADSNLVRQLTRAGRRASWEGGPLSSIPVKLERQRTEATHDTTPNRFVKFALEHWSQIVDDIDLRLAAIPSSPVTLRGRREVAELMSKLEELKHHSLFSDLKGLQRFPANDQVLQKRAGYRDVFKAYIEFEFAARLSWQPSTDSYSAGLQDVATLYEYWAFLQLADVVAKLVGQSFDISPLIQVRNGGLNVALKEGVETVLSGELLRFGRRLKVELCFNRTYRVDGSVVGSWTRQMRPDFSLLISSLDFEADGFEPVVVHFDAKYRVEFLEELFDIEPRSGESYEAEKGLTGFSKRGGALREDLLKMHAYRDAIRRTAGAYVLYPGGDADIDKKSFQQYHELLPGLGAFVLRPSEVGSANGVAALHKFVDDIFVHVATRLTSHERGRYWLDEVYGPSAVGRPAVDPLFKTNVLLGFVKGADHWSWIKNRKSYNVRAEGRTGGVRQDGVLLQCSLLVLYCPSTGQIELARLVGNAERIAEVGMKAAGYPAPRGDYFCVQLSWLSMPASLRKLSARQASQLVKDLGGMFGEPIGISWGELCAAALAS
jgi:predicted component of viral defense system (DUF524 family)